MWKVNLFALSALTGVPQGAGGRGITNKAWGEATERRPHARDIWWNPEKGSPLPLFLFFFPACAAFSPPV